MRVDYPFEISLQLPHKQLADGREMVGIITVSIVVVGITIFRGTGF
jgi:hypothetical protein